MQLSTEFQPAQPVFAALPVDTPAASPYTGYQIIRRNGAAAPAGCATVANLPEPEIVGKVCTLKPGDPGFEGCEACQ
jgi:hypothetical protein